MATVGVVGSIIQANSQPQSVGLVWGLVPTWHLVCIHRMNRVNSHNGFFMMTAP